MKSTVSAIESDGSALRRFFVALVPPSSIQSVARQIEQTFSDRFNSHAAQRSPPHITLQAPFKWPLNRYAELSATLADFAQHQSPVPITLSGFGAFPPKVIYIHVKQTPDLMAIQSALAAEMATTLHIANDRYRTFTPHMTVAFRDLKPKAFKAAWPEFEQRSLTFEFLASHLTLLIHTGQEWTVADRFNLAAKVSATH